MFMKQNEKKKNKGFLIMTGCELISGAFYHRYLGGFVESLFGFSGFFAE